MPAKKGKKSQPPPPAEPELSEQEVADQSLLDKSVVPSENGEGPDPGTFEELRDLDIDANEIYGFSNMEDLKRIMLYLKQFCKLTPKAVQARGACMMASVRGCAAIPYEYTNSHLRRQIVMFVCSWVEYLHPTLHVHIKGNYGRHVRLTKSQYKKKDRDGTLTPEERRDFNEPGPFSLVTYLEAFLDKGFYWDEITLVLMSMMWQIRITVLQAETQIQTKIRHSNTLVFWIWFLLEPLGCIIFHQVSFLDFIVFLKLLSFFALCSLWLHRIGCMCTMLVAYAPRWLCHIMVGLSSLFYFQSKKKLLPLKMVSL